MEVINLNFIPSGANPVAHASQFDEGRTTRFNLFDGSAVYTLDGTEIITVSVRKPDGHIVTEAVTNTSDSYVEVVTTEQMTACAGDNLAQIKVEKGGDTIGFLNYILQVQKDPEDGGDPSASFIHDLDQQIADAVADQYDAADVVFDAVPTAGHGVGFAVTSEGVKNAIPDELDDLSDVTYTGTPSSGEAVVWDGSKWTNGTVSTVGSIDDLNDVDTTGKAEGDSLRYDSGSSEWVAKPIVIEVTQAEYDQLVLDGDLQPLTTYVLTDAPNLNATSEDLSYDGGATSTHDVIEGKADSADVYTKTQIDDKLSLTQSLRVQIVRGAESYKAVYQSSEGGLTNPYGILIFGYTVLSIASSIGSTYDLSALADIQGSSGFTLTSGVLKFGTDANRQWVCLMPRNIKLVKQT